MGRGISSTILTELNRDVIDGGFFFLFDLELRSGTKHWDKRGILTADTSITYEPRILTISDISFSPGATQQITVTVSNADGALTTIDQSESLYGCRVTLRQYVPAAGLSFVVWSGWLEEITELSPAEATLTMYSDTAGMRKPLPGRVVGVTCPSEFAYIANWISSTSTEFDGAECAYQAASTIGFVGSLVGDITSGATSITVLLGSTNVAAGMQYKVSDQVKLGSEIMQVTGITAINGSYQQTLTVTRGARATTPAAHLDTTTVKFANCQKTTTACTCRGMYGNNPSDTF